MNYSVNLSSGQTVEVVIGEAAQINIEQALNYIESGRVEITNYVNEWAKPEITNYTNEYAKPIVTEIVNQTTKPLIDDYLNTTTKPQIDEYVADNVKPYADSAQNSAAKAKISEDNAKTSETNAKASELAAASSAGVASAAAVTATEAKDYTAKVLTDENLKTVGQDLQSADSNIKTVATNILNVNTVAKNIDNVNLLAPHTEAMEALAPDIMDVVTVAGITEQTKNVSDNMAHVVAVDNNKANIDKAVTNEANITTVATDINNVNAVADNKANIDSVAENKTNINNVSVNMPFVEGVSENVEHVVAVDRNKANIDNVATNKTNINTVSANITAVNNVFENMADVKNAVQSANDAKLWAVGTKTEKPEGSSKYWAEQAKNIVQIPDATETVKGIVRLATSEEVTVGTNNSAAITPLKLKQKIAQDLTNPSANTVPSTKAVKDESSRIITLINAKDSLPPQSGQSGKFLTTDGTKARWADVGGGLEIGDIGFAPLGIDETQNKRRYLNGQVISQAQFVSFTNKIKSAIKLYPNLATTETNWQAEVTNSKLGQCGKFVIDNTAGTIRLPKVVNINGLQDLALMGSIKAESLPNITGFEDIWGIGTGTDNPSGSYKKIATGKNADITRGGGQFQTYLHEFDASGSSSTYQNNAPVQQEAIQYPYYIQVATGVEETLPAIREYKINTPFFFGQSMYSDVAPDNASWLASNGQYNARAVYPDYYDWLVEQMNAGVSGFVASTAAYTDYDFVVNQNDQTFRLPLKNGQEGVFADNTVPSGWNLYYYVGETIQDASLINAGAVLGQLSNKADIDASNFNADGKSLLSGLGMPSSRYIDLTLGASGTTYTAPANGWIFWDNIVSIADYIEIVVEYNNNLLYSQQEFARVKGSIQLLIPIKNGHSYTVYYEVTGDTLTYRFYYAEGEN